MSGHEHAAIAVHSPITHETAAVHIPHAAEHGGEHSEHHVDPVSGSFILVFVVLMIGQIAKHICNKYKLPYTPFLALIGLLVGLSSMSDS